jgi:hypothetical protein
MKLCTRCKIEKPLSEFPARKKAKDGNHLGVVGATKIFGEGATTVIIVSSSEDTRKVETD